MKKYEQELFAQKTPYLQWLKLQETELERQYGHAPGKQVYKLPFSSCMDSVQRDMEFCDDVIYLFVKNGGSLSEYAGAVLADAFSDSEDVAMAYADEDHRGSLKELYGIEDTHCCAEYRGAPWFKPDFSPDTLVSFFYIGSVFAIRGSKILEMTGKYGSDSSIYELVYRIFMQELDRRRQGKAQGIVHMPKVLYTNDSLEDTEQTDSSEKIRQLDLADDRSRGAQDKVSVIIPSKDNADVLRKCMETLVRYTDYSCYELIIVDNGSSPEQKKCITHCIEGLKREKKDLVIRYLYQECAFNFSAMCNIGARSADGRFLLFLNDDIEIMDTEDGRQWLGRMAVYSAKAHVGAVGAKLYYPPEQKDTTCYKIQHAGITNMGIGPAHKLGGMADEGDLYHGHNTRNYDMLAVTAACLLIRKSVFDAAGGFDETFPVAYNDVELCFRLYQRGYFNVQVNEAVLIHHESLSRGKDTSPERQHRLEKEKRKLYQKYPLLNARDPFYSPNLVQWKKDVEYNTGYLYACDRQAEPVLLGSDGETGKRKQAVFKKYDARELLHARCGLAARICDRLTGYRDILFHIDNIYYDNICFDNDCSDSASFDNVSYEDGIISDKITDNNIVIEGWCAVRNADNAELPRKLWLICDVRGQDFRDVYEFDIAPKLREDVAAVLEDGKKDDRTKNTALSGIQVKFAVSALKPGTYRIGAVCGGRLVCDPEKCVRVFHSDKGKYRR